METIKLKCEICNNIPTDSFTFKPHKRMETRWKIGYCDRAYQLCYPCRDTIRRLTKRRPIVRISEFINSLKTTGLG